MYGAEQSAAINRRGTEVHGEYHKKAHDADVKWNGTAQGATGPIQARLSSFNRVLGFAVGAFGECSDDISGFVGEIAKLGAERTWRGMGARSKAEARGIIRQQIISSLGVVAVRSNAACLLTRLGVAASGNPKQAGAARKKARIYARMRRDWWYLQSAANMWDHNYGPGGVY